jgi:hypothetical protein
MRPHRTAFARAALIAVATAFLLAACGGGGGNPGECQGSDQVCHKSST